MIALARTDPFITSIDILRARKASGLMKRSSHKTVTTEQTKGAKANLTVN
jgi:hypothetical protein